MHLPSWLEEVAQPFRWAVAGTLGLAAVGAVYGIVESARDYPLTSWFGVIMYTTFLGGIAGFVVGILAGALARKP